MVALGLVHAVTAAATSPTLSAHLPRAVYADCVVVLDSAEDGDTVPAWVAEIDDEAAAEVCLHASFSMTSDQLLLFHSHFAPCLFYSPLLA